MAKSSTKKANDHLIDADCCAVLAQHLATQQSVAVPLGVMLEGA